VPKKEWGKKLNVSLEKVNKLRRFEKNEIEFRGEILGRLNEAWKSINH